MRSCSTANRPARAATGTRPHREPGQRSAPLASPARIINLVGGGASHSTELKCDEITTFAPDCIGR